MAIFRVRRFLPAVRSIPQKVHDFLRRKTSILTRQNMSKTHFCVHKTHFYRFLSFLRFFHPSSLFDGFESKWHFDDTPVRAPGDDPVKTMETALIMCFSCVHVCTGTNWDMCQHAHIENLSKTWKKGEKTWKMHVFHISKHVWQF